MAELIMNVFMFLLRVKVKRLVNRDGRSYNTKWNLDINSGMMRKQEQTVGKEQIPHFLATLYFFVNVYELSLYIYINTLHTKLLGICNLYFQDLCEIIETLLPNIWSAVMILIVWAEESVATHAWPIRITRKFAGLWRDQEGMEKIQCFFKLAI